MRAKTILSLAATGLIATTLAATGAMAQDAQVIRMGDASMSCSQIASDANAAAQILGGAPAGGLFASEQAINAVTGAAMQGALTSGAGRMIPGLGMLGNVAGGIARRDRERREAEQEVAQKRWYYLNGLYSGRGCDAASPSVSGTAQTTPGTGY